MRANLVLVAMDLGKAKAVPDELRLLMIGFQSGRLDINRFDE